MTKYVRLTQLVAKLSDSDDRLDLPAGDGGKGSFKDYAIPAELQQASEEAILDWFHGNIAIGDVEDFGWAVMVAPTDTTKLASNRFQIDRTYSRRRIAANSESFVQDKRYSCGTYWLAVVSNAAPFVDVVFEFVRKANSAKFQCYGVGRRDRYPQLITTE